MQFEFHIHHAREAARVVRILSLLDPKTGKPTKKSPRCLLAKQNAMVEVSNYMISPFVLVFVVFAVVFRNNIENGITTGERVVTFPFLYYWMTS